MDGPHQYTIVRRDANGGIARAMASSYPWIDIAWFVATDTEEGPIDIIDGFDREPEMIDVYRGEE